MAAVHFFYQSVDMPKVILLLLKVDLRFLDDHSDDQERQWEGSPVPPMVICQLMDSIITRTPSTVVTEVIAWTGSG